MKKFLVIVFLMLFAQLHAQVRVGAKEARATAQRFLSQQGKQTCLTLALNEEIKSEESRLTNLYVFSVEPQGFVIVSALGEVLAYSLTSQLPESRNLPSHITYWIDLYNRQTDHLMAHPEQQRKPLKSQNAVGPLLTSAWGQGCYHNKACPVDADGPCGHVSAGCVAIAMAQIMYYHKLPLNGFGSITYSCPPYGTLSANFGQTTYQWEEMADTLHESNSAVAQLVKHCGFSVKMQYGPSLSLASNADAIEAFQMTFSYPTATLSSRDSYTDEEWRTLIMQNLDRQLPVYYTGTSTLGGHALVCDGYDDNGLFHFNFGWDGVADGFYAIDDPWGFSTSQSAIHNIIPMNDLPIQSDEHGIIYVAQDGTGNGSSWQNATPDLQSAMFKSLSGNFTIWVKEGRYTGNPSDEYAFLIVRQCWLYGGFKGDEPYDYDLTLRDFEAHPTILDGNHSQRVVHMNSSYCVLDGFTIQNGHAAAGGGLLAKNTVRIKNCKFRNNYAKSYGGGMARQNAQTLEPITVEDCEFSGNESKNSGGAIYDAGNSTFLRCQIHNNIAKKGGGICCYSKQLPSQYINCTISNNIAQEGGGIAARGEEQTFWSCLISNNTAETGGGLSLKYGNRVFNCTIVKNEALNDYGGVDNSMSPNRNKIRNCIIWGNVSAGTNAQIGPQEHYLHCAVQDDLSEIGSNFNANAENDGTAANFYVRFMDADVAAGSTGHGGNWRLRSNSPCIDRAKSIENQPLFDLDGNPRKRHRGIDLGTYESDFIAHIFVAYYCEDNPYYYQDSLISDYGTYTFLHTDQPCDSLVVIEMKEPPPTVFLTEEICTTESYDFFGTPLSQSGTYTVTDRCVTYELQLSVKSPSFVYLNKEICDGEAYDFFGEYLYESGVYSTTVGCKTYILNLTTTPSSYVPIHMEKEICEGEVYHFFNKFISKAGQYVSKFNCSEYILDLTVNPPPTLQCSNDTIVEFGHSIQLSVSGANTYLWSTGDTTACITVYPIVDKTYSVTGFSESGCSSTAHVKVKVMGEDEEMILFPNPTDNKVNIFMPLMDEVEVLNLFGQPMERIKTERQPIELDVSHYPNGIYIVHVRQLNNHSYKKLAVKH